MKKILFTTLIGFLIQASFAQPYGNEWINFNQQYFKITVSQTGICRISSAQLTAAGVPIGDFSPQNVQIFYRGNEIPIYINGENISILDYVEFYAQRNNGWFDSVMYDAPGSQSNPYYSLVTDTSAYFFTWNNAFNNLRYSPENDIAFTGYTPAPYIWYTSLVQYTNRYLDALADCQFTSGEGFFDAEAVSMGNSLTKSVNTQQVFTSGPEASLSFAIAGYSRYYHHLNVSLNSMVFLDTLFPGITTLKFNSSILSSQLIPQNQFVFKSINDLNVPSDYQALSFINIRYPRKLIAENTSTFEFEVPASIQKTYLEITQFSSGTVAPLLYDITHRKKIKTVLENNIVKALIPASTSLSHCILVSTTANIAFHKIKEVQFTNHQNQSSKYIIVTHPSLINAAYAYKTYRNAVMANVEELYNQFGYGLDKHPVAIRNFTRYALDKWTIKPKFLLLAGKGVAIKYIRQNPSAWNYCLVPSIGNPASDNLFTAGISTNIMESSLATGRIAARTPGEITDYLNKVIEFESNPPAAWMKNIIHFGGGKDAQEQTDIINYLKNFETIIEDTLFGGYVSTFLKNSSSPIQITQSDSIRNLIEDGVSMMTFFGHAASTIGFDQQIDEPSSFSNQGKYPLLLANSCYSGDIHLAGNNSISEKWVLIPNRGTIGFLASVGLGETSYLNIFSALFYQNLAYHSYGKSIGECIQSTAHSISETYPGNTGLKNTIHEFTLHGDPAIILNSFPKTDLSLETSSIFYAPANVTAEIDSFDVKIIVTNIGKTFSGSYQVNVTRILQDGSQVNRFITSYGILYKDTLSLRFAVDRIKGTGNNIFRIVLDSYNIIDELSELNNNAEAALFIRSTDVVPIFPVDQALVPDYQIVLKASTGDALAPLMQIQFEIDTTVLFNSLFRKTQIVSQSGGVVEWELPFEAEANRVYYWRTSKIPGSGQSFNWKTSSFTYKPQIEGWSQSHYYQFRGNSFQFEQIDPSTRNFKFITIPKQLNCHNIGSPTANDFWYIKYDIDGSGDYGVCGYSHSMLIAIIDSTTLLPWLSDQGNYGQVDYPRCFISNRQIPDKYFMFYTTDTVSLTAMTNFLNDTVPEGAYILAWSARNGNVQIWPEATLQAYENLGAANIRSILNDYPFIFFTQKGKPQSSQLIIGQNATAVIDFSTNIKTNFNYGQVVSNLIGPGTNWEYLKWNAHKKEDNPAEKIMLKVEQVNYTGNTHLVADSIAVETDSVSLTGVNLKSDYPFMRLSLYSHDEQYRTPAQLDQWMMDYQPAPELAVNASKGFYFRSDTVNEGEAITFATVVENVGMQPTDSILLYYWIQDRNNALISVLHKKVKPLQPSTFLSDTIHYSTLGLKGNNVLWMEVNSTDSSTATYDQPEQYHFNNLIGKSFYVEPDHTNPLLDITFNGIHIMDGELVSAKPEILIQLKDENQFLALNDTSLFAIYLKFPFQTLEQRIYFDQLQWIPASLPDNSCQIVYRPEFTVDGIYQIRVQARDASNNESGQNDYKISFKIVTESTISEVFNYPNPFSTSTRFVFTLTGSEIPDEFHIQIMTVTGRIVKTINIEELGPIRIGRNITDYTWDGTDTYGDRLANGVYFYRISCSSGGQSIKKSDNGQSKYFKQNLGKMFLMR